jgi:hypothetical protein
VGPASDSPPPSWHDSPVTGLHITSGMWGAMIVYPREALPSGFAIPFMAEEPGAPVQASRE